MQTIPMIKPKLPLKTTKAMSVSQRLTLTLHWHIVKPWLWGTLLLQGIAWLCAYAQCETTVFAGVNRLLGWQVRSGQCDLSQLYSYYVLSAFIGSLLLSVGIGFWMLKQAPASVRAWLFALKHDADFKNDMEYGFHSIMLGSAWWGMIIGVFCLLLFTGLAWGMSLTHVRDLLHATAGAALDRDNVRLLLLEHYPIWLIASLGFAWVRLWLLNNMVLFLCYVWMRITGRLNEE
ncbi:hypothetical protein LVJ82_15125 [Vitreoscilla massiliensis]|uniref:Uncharacterized protein n=1 Tax=Vitreoscilla massiliensis TaxID=1689272 RepID=A0ABY4E062_9NEIS|nr:hypothetical protein [Vitreoscilla massiliensis]UOO88775.1 hypothetical protein LVJ82_15125 [Vitreoscilla massiliensis]